MKTTIDIKVRPVRIGFIVDPNSKQWLKECLFVNSVLWGGVLNVLIPFTKRISKFINQDKTNITSCYDIVNGMIKNFDLDLIVFTEKIEKDRINFNERLIVPISDFSNLFRGEKPKYGINVFEVLYQFHIKEYKFIRKHPIPFVHPKFNSDDLFLSSIFGFYNEENQKIWETYYDELEVKESICNYSNYFEFLRKEAYYIRRLTTLNLEVKSRPNRNFSCIVLIMNRNNNYDIIDYHNLIALGYRVYPIDLFSYSDKLRDSLIDELESKQYKLNFPPDYSSESLIVKGRSVKQEAFNLIQEDLSDKHGCLILRFLNIVPAYYTSDYRFSRLINRSLVYENETKVQAEVKEKNGVKEYSFENVLPSFVKKERYVYDRNCFVNEISIWNSGLSKTLESQVIPAGIQDLFLSYSGLKHSWRISEKSINYLSDQHLRNITLRIPKPIDIFKSLLKLHDLELVQTELAQSTEKAIFQLGGHLGILQTIIREPVIKFLHEFENQKVQTTAAALGELKKLLKVGKNNQFAQTIIDELVEKKVLSIGFQISCNICRQKNWYNLSELQFEILCGKCLSNYKLPYSKPKSFNLAYRTKGAFSLNSYAQGIYCPILTLNFFNHNLETLTTPMFSLKLINKVDKNEYEIDLLLLTQENRFDPSEKRMVMSECKVYKYFDKEDFDRMKTVGDKFPEAFLLFSTLRRKLELKEKTELKKLLKYRANKKQKMGEILILTGNELFTWKNPPYCWEDIGYEEKYSHFHSNVSELTTLAKATQDIYLTL